MAYKPTMDDIKKLRTMTGAGLGDVKKSLVEAEGDFDKAKDLLRERGLAIAAKRSDRETSNGCLLVKKVDDFAAMVAVKCETDFVANGQDFIAMVQEILDQAVENRCKTLDEVKTLKLANGDDAVTAVQQRSGITGEKMEIDGYNFLEGDNLYVYDHMNRHMLATIVRLSESNEDAGHKVAMQVAAMKPIALDEASVPQSVKDEELKVAIEKTKEEQVEVSTRTSSIARTTSSPTSRRAGSLPRMLRRLARSAPRWVPRRLPTCRSRWYRTSPRVV